MAQQALRYLLILFVIHVLVCTVSGGVWDWVKKKPTDKIFASSKARKAADNVLKWQCNDGGWPKGKDTTKSGGSCGKSTFDNGATTGEILFLSRVIAKGHTKGKGAAKKGIELLLKAQYSNGGWPQYHKAKGYHKAITINDNTMPDIMRVMYEVMHNSHNVYSWVGNSLRDECRRAWNKALPLLLKLQLKDKSGRYSIWAAQYDKDSLKPTYARSYEPPSLATYESCGVVELLMSIANPSAAVKRAVHRAMAWFDHTKLDVKIVKTKKTKECPGKKVMAIENGGGPSWARFQDVRTAKTIVCSRANKYPPFNCYDDIRKVSCERRGGYSWYNTRPVKLRKQYNKWRARYRTFSEFNETTVLSHEHSTVPLPQ